MAYLRRHLRRLFLLLLCVAISVYLFLVIFGPCVLSSVNLSLEDDTLLKLPPFLYFAHHDYIIRTYELYRQLFGETLMTLLQLDYGFLYNRTKEFKEDIAGLNSSVILKILAASMLVLAIKMASNWGKGDKELTNLCDASDVHLNTINSILKELDEKAKLKALRSYSKEKLEDILTASTSTVSWPGQAPSKSWSDELKIINEEFPVLNDITWAEQD